MLLNKKYEFFFGLYIAVAMAVVTCLTINLSISLKNTPCDEVLNSETLLKNVDETSFFKTEEVVVIDDFEQITTDEPVVVETEVPEVSGIEIPLLPTNMSLYTDYRFYNLSGSPSYRLQQVSYTDEYGCRRFNDDYVVGLGTYYSTDIGDRFEVTLDNGNVFTIILGDNKADRDTDPTNRYTECMNYDGQECANVIEFIVDTEKLTKGARLYGSLSYYPHLDGNILKMKYLGRDSSGDWSTYF